MKRTIMKLGVPMVLVMLTLGCGKNESDKEKSASPRSESSAPIAGQPEDFFPAQLGLKWTYEISIGDAEPLRYNETSWPLGDRRVVYANRGRFLPVVKGGARSSFI